MAEAHENSAPKRADEERKQLRPYRMLVRIVFFVAVTTGCAFILRGIIRHLDRMPSIETFSPLERVDDRALRACGDDLIKLDKDIRARAAVLLGAIPEQVEGSPEPFRDLEQQRLQIAARCRLNEPGEDPVAKALSSSANHSADLIRQYNLLYDRYRQDVIPHSHEANKNSTRAIEILKNR